MNSVKRKNKSNKLRLNQK